MDDLVDMCPRILSLYWTKENVCDFLLLAHKYKLEEFKDIAIDFILHNNIIKSENWKWFSVENVELALEVYRVYVEGH